MSDDVKTLREAAAFIERRKPMKREEAEKLIAGYERAAETNPAHTDLIIHVTAISLRELIALARLGASVADPTAEEIEAMAKALYELEHDSDNTPFAEVCLSECQREYWTDQARAAIAAMGE